MPMMQIKGAVQAGRIQMGEILLGAYGEDDPLFELDCLPGLADTYSEARILGGVIEPAIRARLEKQGLTVFGLLAQPKTQVFTRGFGFREPGNLKRMNVLAETPVMRRLVQSLGANVAVAEFAGIRGRLATGASNAVVASASALVAFAIRDQLDTFGNFLNSFPRRAVVVNTDAFMRLTQEDRTALLDAGKKFDGYWKKLQADDEALVTLLPSKGFAVSICASDEMPKWAAVQKTSQAEWYAKAAPEDRALLDAFRALPK
jgi:TRAP-type C4-dicarboxylate transport system substrate-binding protein